MNAAENHCIIGYHTDSSSSHIHPVIIRLDPAGHPFFQETPKPDDVPPYVASSDTVPHLKRLQAYDACSITPQRHRHAYDLYTTDLYLPISP